MKRPLFNKVVIAGVGLMGGSLGLALRRQRLAREVIGLVRRRKTIQEARKVGSIDRGTLSIPRALAGAELVVIGAPVSQVPGILEAMLPHLPAGCLVTDVGSTKQAMLAKVVKLLPENPPLAFVSSHPMAGSEKSGVLVARPELYRGAHCLLIREPWTDPQALARLALLWRAVGCSRVSVISAAEHDAWTAAASHLPHATAVCLANVVADLCESEPRIREVAATGFRDTTRIAASLPGMWTEILMTNRQSLASDLELLQERIGRLAHLLRSGNGKAVEAELTRARVFRMQMDPRRPAKGARP